MRLTEIPARICRETWASQSKARRYNPARVARIDQRRKGAPTLKRRHVLPVGDSDDFALYYADDDRERVYCVGINRRHGYVGVQAYGPNDQEPSEELSAFLQTDYEVEELLGKDGLDRLTDRTIAHRLIGLLDEVTA